MATLYEPALALRDHLAILPVLLPLIGAPLIVIFGSRRTAFFIALTAFIGAFIACAALLLELRTAATDSLLFRRMGAPRGHRI